MKKHIVCLGDSNTHGYCADPGDSADGQMIRFNESERWTCLLQQTLGEEYLVIEEGLNGRTTVFEDPLEEGLAALPYLYPCLKSHKPVALLILMLGTNDTKERFSASPSTIAAGMARLVQKAKSMTCWQGQPNILVVAPPPIGQELEDLHLENDMGRGCAEKSRALAAAYRTMAAENGVQFLDAAEVGAEFNRVDFMHLTKVGHQNLAAALAQRISTMIGR